VTIGELIAQVQKYPANMEVIVASYEEGYDPVTDVREIAIEKAAEEHWYVGVYHAALASDRKALLIHSRFLRSETKA